MHDEQALIVIIDDDEAICRALARLLGAQGFRVRTYTSPRAYLEESDVLDPRCALIDILMPDLDGLSLLRLTRHDGVDVPTVFMTATGDVRTIVDAMKEGATDLLPKPFTVEQLNRAIARALESAAVTDHDRRTLEKVWRTAGMLTPREAEVCGLIACGLLNKHVAAQIGIKEKTVKVHRGRVMQKLGVASFAELVRFVEALLHGAPRTALRIDATEIPRPPSADIIIDVAGRERSRLATSGGPTAVDQRTMHDMA